MRTPAGAAARASGTLGGRALGTLGLFRHTLKLTKTYVTFLAYGPPGPSAGRDGTGGAPRKTVRHAFPEGEILEPVCPRTLAPRSPRPSVPSPPA
ncbi:hypothetical protein Sm713_56750 [Streptomyces sp. TS71-3]|nr:hypothetical protein Sm713_56750 [Streptomyces sp. TS71-3]